MASTGRKRVGMRRFLACLGAGLALSLAIAVGSASAQTVYDYTYSGTYIDGSTIGKSFNSGLAGLAFDRHSQRLMVADGGSPGIVSRFTTSGAPAVFPSLGTPWLQLDSGLATNADIAIDQSGASTDGNFYVGVRDQRLQAGRQPDPDQPRKRRRRIRLRDGGQPGRENNSPHRARRDLSLRRRHGRTPRERLHRPRRHPARHQDPRRRAARLVSHGLRQQRRPLRGRRATASGAARRSS